MENSDKLSGYSIPGVKDKIIIHIHNNLENILNNWCKASGAKFNMEKTEIIPIGSKTHQNKVVNTRKLNQQDQPLENAIRITADGHPIRSLGAWIGNKTNNLTPWETITDKINTDLKRWKKCHPTLDGKRYIVQMIVGGITQFLTKAQGMPRNIESALIKTIRNFIWDDTKSPPINLEQLYRTKEEGNQPGCL
ncbi:hypothetical protein BDR05DRAFT_978681 [Suillus weaverae]|nr:hypothetical protein BDR05DRAFT_978681 [Suillus weaverae]